MWSLGMRERIGLERTVLVSGWSTRSCGGVAVWKLEGGIQGVWEFVVSGEYG